MVLKGVQLQFNHLMGQHHIQFAPSIKHINWIFVPSPEMIGLKWNESLSCCTSMSMQTDQLFHCEPGEGAQTLDDLSSAAAGGRGYIMQKPGPPMLSSRHAEWCAAASHH